MCVMHQTTLIVIDNTDFLFKITLHWECMRGKYYEKHNNSD